MDFMEENDRRIQEAGGTLNLLIDSSVYHEMTKLETETGIHPIDLLGHYPNVKFFFSQAMINENVRGQMGFTQEAAWMFKHSLQDEGAFSGKESRFLYNDVNGDTKVVTLNNISAEDYSQILLAQNHENLVLVTNDHKMLKSAGALLSNRLMDLQNMLDFFATETPDQKIQNQWIKLRDHYKANSGYQPPKTINYIADIARKPHPITGEIPDLKPILTKKKKKS
jgi:hypothetical protein